MQNANLLRCAALSHLRQTSITGIFPMLLLTAPEASTANDVLRRLDRHRQYAVPTRLRPQRFYQQQSVENTNSMLAASWYQHRPFRDAVWTNLRRQARFD